MVGIVRHSHSEIFETLRASLTTYGAPRATEALRKMACQRSIAWAIIALRSVRAAQDRYGVNSSPARRLTGMAEVPQRADRIAAAPRTENVCHYET
jgi:hypothetical protein